MYWLGQALMTHGSCQKFQHIQEAWSCRPSLNPASTEGKLRRDEEAVVPRIEQESLDTSAGPGEYCLCSGANLPLAEALSYPA